MFSVRMDERCIADVDGSPRHCAGAALLGAGFRLARFCHGGSSHHQPFFGYPLYTYSEIVLAAST
jgi:hypothetical protein